MNRKYYYDIPVPPCPIQLLGVDVDPLDKQPCINYDYVQERTNKIIDKLVENARPQGIFTTFTEGPNIMKSPSLEELKKIMSDAHKALEKYEGERIDIFVCLTPIKCELEKHFHKKAPWSHLDTLSGIPIYSFDTEEELRMWAIETCADNPKLKITWIKENAVEDCKAGPEAEGLGKGV